MTRQSQPLAAFALRAAAFFRRAFTPATLAFFARADRSAGVRLAQDLAPPNFPPFLPCSRKYAKAAADNNGFAMAAIITGSWSGFNTVDDQEGVLINSLTSR